MAVNRDKLAALLGAKIVGEVPDVGCGAFGMARLAHILHERLTPSRGERPRRPPNPEWVHCIRFSGHRAEEATNGESEG